MDRRKLHVIGAVWLVAPAALAIPAVEVGSRWAHKHVHVTKHITGAAISATDSVFKVHDSVAGSRAGTQIAMLSTTATSGTDQEKTYGRGTATSHGTFTLGTANAQGVAMLTGSGHDTSGTRKLKKLQPSYTYTGTYNFKPTAYSVTLNAPESY